MVRVRLTAYFLPFSDDAGAAVLVIRENPTGQQRGKNVLKNQARFTLGSSKPLRGRSP
jgi:hypothetical protein